MNHFFGNGINISDPDIDAVIQKEQQRQEAEIQLIASENFVSRAVLEAQGSVLTNKYAEGYSGKRYYGGCRYVDEIEDLAISRLKKLFGCGFANVQSHSGSQANQAAYMACLKPGDIILGMSLNAGGHLTHGSSVNQSGKWFNAVQYGVRREDFLLDYDQVSDMAKQHKPKLIVAGCSAYPRFLDFAKFREIADSVGALLMVDMAHFAGQVAADLYQSPFKYADIVTSTTHKTLRGPRGGIIMTNSEDMAKKINSAVFPGMQGGPLMHVIAAKAVAFHEALSEEYKQYMQQVVRNAKTFAEALQSKGYDIITNGTDCHLLLVNFTGRPNINGKLVEEALDSVGIACNKNAVPFDTQKPFVTSGIRLGTPAVTTRGFKEQEILEVTEIIHSAIVEVENQGQLSASSMQTLKAQVAKLCAQFSMY